MVSTRSRTEAVILSFDGFELDTSSLELRFAALGDSNLGHF
jgi:hypothetical protein